MRSYDGRDPDVAPSVSLCFVEVGMLDALSRPWPWYVAGPLIGLFVPALLLLGNRQFGISSSLRHLCAAIVPGRVEFFRYDWKNAGMWNLAFIGGVFVGGFIAARLLGAGDVAISPAATMWPAGMSKLTSNNICRSGS